MIIYESARFKGPEERSCSFFAWHRPHSKSRNRRILAKSSRTISISPVREIRKVPSKQLSKHKTDCTEGVQSKSVDRKNCFVRRTHLLKCGNLTDYYGRRGLCALAHWQISRPGNVSGFRREKSAAISENITCTISIRESSFNDIRIRDGVSETPPKRRRKGWLRWSQEREGDIELRPNARQLPIIPRNFPRWFLRIRTVTGKCTHHSDGFHREDGQAEKDREVLDGRDLRHILDRRQVPHQVIEGDAQSDAHEDVGDHGDGRKLLQVRNPAEQDQRNKTAADDQPLIELLPGMVVYHLKYSWNHLVDYSENQSKKKGERGKRKTKGKSRKNKKRKLRPWRGAGATWKWINI